MNFGECQSLCVLNCLRSKKCSKTSECFAFLKRTAKPKVLENLEKVFESHGI